MLHTMAKRLEICTDINPIQDGGQKDPPSNFPPVPLTNAGISPKIFLTFSFDPFFTLV